jgi:hypothetical protein
VLEHPVETVTTSAQLVRRGGASGVRAWQWVDRVECEAFGM